MPLTSDYTQLPIHYITVDRSERQRTTFNEGEIQSLAQSISRIGLIHPIIVRTDPSGQIVLVAGERRLLAYKLLNYTDIPVRFAHEIPPTEAKLIELEENVKREDLSWQDRCRALTEIHSLYLSIDPNWTQSKTAQAASVTDGLVSQYLKIAPELNNPDIAQLTTKDQAFRYITDRDRRRITAAVEEGLYIPADPFDDFAPLPEPALRSVSIPYEANLNGANPQESGSSKFSRPAHLDILNTSFLEWAPQYSGPRFSLIHCDFPYGTAEVGPQQIGIESNLYSDTPELYKELVKCLCNNLDRLMAPIGHLMFWYSERLGPWTRCYFESRTNLKLQIHPLIWHHSDNAGISPDTQRRPRHIYDTAILASRGDPFLVKVKSDLFSCPTDRSLHPSTKPIPLLSHFFEMFIDEFASILDPTCGSGSALRAAEALGARRVLGLEIDPSYHATAVGALQSERNERILAGEALFA